MKEAIMSLAVIDTLFETNKYHYTDLFVPFVATLFVKRGYDIIEQHGINKICYDFEDEFGLAVPYFAMITILNKARKKGLLRKEKGFFIVNKEYAAKCDLTATSKKHDDKYEALITAFISYSKREYNVPIKREEADKTIISFLKQYDLEILFATEAGSLLPTVETKYVFKYIFNSFIVFIYDINPDLKEFIIDIAIGSMIANTILYDKTMRAFEGRLKGLDIYLDTKFIFRLVGLEGEDREVAYTAFTEEIRKQKANLKIFGHTYNEVNSILENCMEWLDNPEYNPLYASRVLEHFKNKGYNKLNMEDYIVTFDERLEKHGIVIEEPPSYEKHKKYQIDEIKLEKYIIDRYKKENRNFNELDRRSTIMKDIKSIGSIAKLRKGKKPNKLKDAVCIFVTTNVSLAISSYNFEKHEIGSRNRIGACLTDVFVGTLFWLENPQKASLLNERKIIADCLAAIEPNAEFRDRLLKEAKKLRDGDYINEEQFYLINSNRFAREWFIKKIMGDSESITDKNILEAIEEYEAEIREQAKIEEREKLGEVIASKDTEVRNLSSKISEMENTINDISEKHGKLGITVSKTIKMSAKVISITVFSFLILLMLLLITSNIISHIYTGYSLLFWISIFLSVGFGVMNLIFGLNFRSIKQSINDKISSIANDYFFS